jgi:hypothetical protein
MVNGRSGTESPCFSNAQVSTTGNANRISDVSFKRRDVLNVLLGLAVAGAGVDSSFAVSTSLINVVERLFHNSGIIDRTLLRIARQLRIKE